MSAAGLDLEHPFWRFSLAVYRDKDVQAECLDVQERLGADVNLLLFCAYLGAVEGATLGPADIEAAAARVSAWHDEAVRPLRAARRSLKPWTEAQSAFAREAALVRQQVQGLEIKTEQIEQALLWEWLQRRGRLATDDHGKALRANLGAFLARHGGGADDAGQVLGHLIRAAGTYEPSR
jgi:uncharacterized protein (TIGR02444 family)